MVEDELIQTFAPLRAEAWGAGSRLPQLDRTSRRHGHRRIPAHLATIALALGLLGAVACAAEDDAESPDASAAPSATTSTTPPPSSPSPSRPGDTVTDFNGPRDIGVRFTVPQGVREIEDGPGKRAYELMNGDGHLLVGELKHLYAVRSNGLLDPRRVGNDAAAALDVIRSRKDYEVLAQGTVPVDGSEVPLVAIRLAEGAFATDLWCFTHDTSCYKNPEGLTAQTILIPWRDSMIWMNAEWSGGGTVPAALVKARDELLGSLKLE